MRNIEHVRNLFQRSIGRRVTTSAPTDTKCGKAIGFASRYFSHVNDVDPASVESVPESIDPSPQRYLQTMLDSYGQLVYTSSNSVEYYIASGGESTQASRHVFIVRWVMRILTTH